MADEKAEWFIPGRDRKPVGPYTTEQVIRALRIGRIKPQTVCWREGMAEWLPIEQVPALAHLLQPAQMQRGLTRFQCSCGNEIVMSAKFAGKQAKCSGCGAVVTVPAAVPEAPVPVAKPKRSFVSKLIVLLLLAGLGAGAYYFVVADYLKLRKAEEFIKKESYSKASKELRGLDKSFLFKNQAIYLEGLIEVYEFASQEGPHEISVSQIFQGKNPLSGSQRSLKKACKAEPKCKDRVQGDLTNAFEAIPSKIQDRLARVLAVNLLRNELNAADKIQLAQQVIDALKGNTEFQQRFDQYKPLVMLLLAWDPSSMSVVLTALAPEDATVSLFYSRNLRLMYQWAQEKPELQSELTQAILTSVKNQLDSDPLIAVGMLDNLVGYLPEENKPEAAALYWQVAKRLKEEQPLPARRAFVNALKIKPDIGQGESDVLFRIDMATNIDENKLTLYKTFLETYPQSAQRAKVLALLVADASNAAKQLRYYTHRSVSAYLDAALPAAQELLQDHAQTTGLDILIQDLARTIQKYKRNDEALSLAKSILEKIPNTSLKSDIENEIQQWEQGPSQTTSSNTNKVPANNTYAPVPPAPTPTTPLPATTPPTSTTPSTPKKNEPTLVKSAAELEEALKNPDMQKVMWVRLAGRNVTPDQKRQLQFWVANGGVLWLETDLVKTFRFPNLKSIPRNLTQGRARVYQDKHSVLQGIGGTQVPFEVEPGQVGIGMQGRFSPPKGIIPLMVIETAQNEYTAIAALKTYQKGYLILRPAKIQTDTQPGQKFDQNLRNFSFNPPPKTTPGYRPVP